MRSRAEVRGNAPQSRHLKNLARESSRTLEPSRAGLVNNGRPESMEAVREARASSAWSCNNPDHGAHADEQGIDLQHCIACSGVVAAPQSNAPKQRERSSESPNKLASRNASTTNLGAQVIRVEKYRVDQSRPTGLSALEKLREPLSSGLSTAASSLSNDSSGLGLVAIDA